MATGETEHSRFDGSLLIGWDGECLHWVAASQDAEVIDHGKEEELAALDALAQRFPEANNVRLTLLRPVCSLIPSAVSTGIESNVLALQHGPKTETFASKSFHSERLGEDVALIESGHWTEEDVFLKAFPMAQWTSATLGAIEAGLQSARRDGWESSVHIDVGEKRALMMHFRGDALRWCSVTEDLEGDGILYHVVNALHRDGVELGNAQCHVVFTGVPEERMLSQFRRFFASIERGPHVELGSTALLMHART